MLTLGLMFLVGLLLLAFTLSGSAAGGASSPAAGGASSPKGGGASSSTGDARRPKTVVSLTFDDGRQTQYAAREPLRAHGMHGTFYVNSGLMGSTTGDWHMTWDQLRGMAEDGNEIGGHSLSHAHLKQLHGAELRREICQDRMNLRARGFAPVASFAYPFTEHNRTVASMARRCGYSSARWGGGIRSPDCGYCPLAETIPPKNPWVIRTPTDVGTDTTLAMMKRDVTQAEAHGGWAVLVFHSVCNACDSLSIRPDQLTAFLDWLQPRSSIGTVVKTHGEVIAERGA
jgi:peptidoglycan/xylan/chitin deacetylase (PgdA/CDA1 family)